MSAPYRKFQKTATRLLKKWKQGSVILRRITVTPIDPTQPWLGNTEATQDWPLNAVVKRLNHRNIGGTLISETGDEVTFADPGTAPVLSDLLIIDGAERAVNEVRPVVGAGLPVAWKIWSKA